MTMFTTAAEIPTAGARLDADLIIPQGSGGLVLFAHGSGSSRHSPRNRAVAELLTEGRLATVLVDLLTGDEERQDARAAHLRFDIELLADRLVGIIDWLGGDRATAALPVGLFGASTGAAAALVAAARRPGAVRAVVSRGGRPDLAAAALPRVTAPTLLIVGERDVQVAQLNEQARRQLSGPVELRVIPRATHLFEEPGALHEVALHAAAWFRRHLGADG